jgi:hypothetical protein
VTAYPVYLQTMDAAVRLGVSVSKLNRLARSHPLPGVVRLGPYVGFPEAGIADLSRWLKDRGLIPQTTPVLAPVAEAIDPEWAKRETDRVRRKLART